MKVFMINTVSGYGSTGSICVDIAVELEKLNHECLIAFGQGQSGYKNGYKIGTKIENHLHNLGSRIFGNQGYYSQRGTNKLINKIEKYNPDIIHLHNLHGNYLHLETLFNYLKKLNKPIFWTLHDCWSFTGKCAHYTIVNCFKWQTECNLCPQIKKYPPSLFLDRSKEMYYDKKELFLGVDNMTIVTVSHWLEEQVNKSFLHQYPIKTIYNWVDSTIFKDYYCSNFIKSYSIDTTKFTIILVSANWDKEDYKFKNAIALSNLLGENYQILLIGKLQKRIKIPNNVIAIDYLNGKDKLAQFYSFASVYVHLSVEDTFGKVIAESLSCGTPAIVYNSTACPEIIDNNTGVIVEINTIKDVIKAIKNIEKKGKNYYKEACIERVEKKFNRKTNINSILSSYYEKLD